MSDGLKFSLDRIEVSIEIDGKAYILSEATGEVACKYRNYLTSNMTMGPGGGIQRMDNIADSEPMLVSMCLSEILEDGTKKRVPVSVVKGWPSRVVKSLFDEASKISNLFDTDENKESAKNSQPSTTDGLD